MLTASSDLFVDVSVSLPNLGALQYAVPSHLQPQVEIGKRAWVSLRNRKLIGYIVGTSSEKLFKEIRDIDSIADETPILSPAFLELARWMSEYYMCSLGLCIESIMPAAFKKGKFFMKSRSSSSGGKHDIVNPHDLDLTSDQRLAFQKINDSLKEGKAREFLLHGITGSGKTEVYMHLIREVLAEGKSAIVLVPEISLTPQTVERFLSRFGEGVAVIHSRLTQARKVEEWHRIRSGKARLVVGARSAIFSPVQNLGLIVIDEEHDTSYKQAETPRYETYRVAQKRIEQDKAVLLLGSATPSLETYYAAMKKRIEYLHLPKRIENRPLPDVEVIDMRREPLIKGERIFSKRLEDRIKEALFKKEQVMLLLNRRGFSTHVHCSSCGFVLSCPNCRLSLTYHFDSANVMCHSCGHRTHSQKICPACQKAYLHYFGMGTQKVEAELKRLFPDAKVTRMDADSTARKGAHEEILRAFKKKEVDILIGTQMIAKGHDFPNVSLIGVISADTALHIPDFRAAERTFNLLTQVAGRAGRGDIPGKVVVQTYVPHHYAISSAKDHNYSKFYDQEMTFRNELQMPPLTEIIQIVFKSYQEKELVRQITEFSKNLSSKLPNNSFKFVGPAPCLLSKEKGEFRWNIFLRGPSIEAIQPILRAALNEFKRKSTQLVIDVNPQ